MPDPDQVKEIATSPKGTAKSASRQGAFVDVCVHITNPIGSRATVQFIAGGAGPLGKSSQQYEICLYCVWLHRSNLNVL